MRYWALKWRTSRLDFDLGTAVALRNSVEVWRMQE